MKNVASTTFFQLEASIHKKTLQSSVLRMEVILECKRYK